MGADNSIDIPNIGPAARLRARGLAALLVAASALAGGAASAHPRTVAMAAPALASAPAVKLTALKVSKHVYSFHGDSGMADHANKGFMSNAGFVVTSDGVVVFDALGTPALGEAMVRAIGAVTSQPIRRVIVSHYHADHFYGLQALKAAGAEIWAHREAKSTFSSDLTQTRLKQRRAALKPWVNEQTRLVPADRWLDFGKDKAIAFEMGGVRMRVIDMGGAHSPEDVMLAVDDDKVLFAGDLFFTGRIPFVGEADSGAWLGALERMLEMKPVAVVPGHGKLSRAPMRDMQLTRSYLLHLRRVMGEAVANMVPFEEAYAKADWSGFEKQPAFAQANRLNAFGTYLLMERESLQPK